jgi:hypothetical protein
MTDRSQAEVIRFRALGHEFVKALCCLDRGSESGDLDPCVPIASLQQHRSVVAEMPTGTDVAEREEIEPPRAMAARTHAVILPRPDLRSACCYSEELVRVPGTWRR